VNYLISLKIVEENLKRVDEMKEIQTRALAENFNEVFNSVQGSIKLLQKEENELSYRSSQNFKHILLKLTDKLPDVISKWSFLFDEEGKVMSDSDFKLLVEDVKSSLDNIIASARCDYEKAYIANNEVQEEINVLSVYKDSILARVTKLQGEVNEGLSQSSAVNRELASIYTDGQSFEQSNNGNDENDKAPQAMKKGSNVSSFQNLRRGFDDQKTLVEEIEDLKRKLRRSHDNGGGDRSSLDLTHQFYLNRF
jgi:hypothetical protein